MILERFHHAQKVTVEEKSSFFRYRMVTLVLTTILSMTGFKSRSRTKSVVDSAEIVWRYDQLPNKLFIIVMNVLTLVQ